jgi:hypothetical protein
MTLRDAVDCSDAGKDEQSSCWYIIYLPVISRCADLAGSFTEGGTPWTDILREKSRRNTNEEPRALCLASKSTRYHSPYSHERYTLNRITRLGNYAVKRGYHIENSQLRGYSILHKCQGRWSVVSAQYIDYSRNRSIQEIIFVCKTKPLILRLDCASRSVQQFAQRAGSPVLQILYGLICDNLTNPVETIVERCSWHWNELFQTDSQEYSPTSLVDKEYNMNPSREIPSSRKIPS